MNAEQQLRKQGVPERDLQILAKIEGGFDRALAGRNAPKATALDRAEMQLRNVRHFSEKLERIAQRPVNLGELITGQYKEHAQAVSFDLLDEARKGLKTLEAKFSPDHVVPSSDGEPLTLTQWKEAIDVAEQLAAPYRAAADQWQKRRI